jgi:hypothetical protein
MTIHIVGGVYGEYCTRPQWDQTYGSAGRAACAIAAVGTPVDLHCYVSKRTAKQLDVLRESYHFAVLGVDVPRSVSFEYFHDLARPDIFGVPDSPYEAIKFSGEKVLRYGMLEGDAVVSANMAVYDPQNMGAPLGFRDNGSSANRLALVLNLWEAKQFSELQDAPAAQVAEAVAHRQGADVVVVKMGPAGALVWFAGKAEEVPAYRTNNVWKIGSGDCFAAYFAKAWMSDGMSPREAADVASRATAFYCETQGFASQADIKAFSPASIKPSQAFREGAVREVYLAGPFFDLGQTWMVQECRATLRSMGLKVFSPFHDIGLGSADDVVQLDIDGLKKADLVFAIVDGLDSGTLFEVGYACSLGTPVIALSERQTADEDLKMLEGSGCEICPNLATAVYKTLWRAAEL